MRKNGNHVMMERIMKADDDAGGQEQKQPKWLRATVSFSTQ